MAEYLTLNMEHYSYCSSSELTKLRRKRNKSMLVCGNIVAYISGHNTASKQH